LRKGSLYLGRYLNRRSSIPSAPHFNTGDSLTRILLTLRLADEWVPFDITPNSLMQCWHYRHRRCSKRTAQKLDFREWRATSTLESDVGSSIEATVREQNGGKWSMLLVIGALEGCSWAVQAGGKSAEVGFKETGRGHSRRFFMQTYSSTISTWTRRSRLWAQHSCRQSQAECSLR